MEEQDGVVINRNESRSIPVSRSHLEVPVENLLKEKEILTAQLDQSMSLNNALQKGVDSCTKLYAMLDTSSLKQIQEYTVQLGKSKCETAKTLEMNATLQKKLDEKQSVESSFQSRIEELLDSLAKSESDLAKQSEMNATLQKKLDEKQSIESSTQSRIEELLDSLAKSESNLAEQSEMNATLQKKLDEKQSIESSTQSRIVESLDSLAKSESDLAEQSEMNATLQKKLDEKQAIESSTQSRIVELLDSLAKSENDLAKMSQINATLQNKLDEGENIKQKFITFKNEANIIVAQLKDQIVKLSKCESEADDQERDQKGKNEIEPSLICAGETTAEALGVQQKCLSVAQPWASLLLAGVKKHEGRSWTHKYKGRLWISSTRNKPTNNDFRLMRELYRDRKNLFPDDYPTGCLLGYVQLEDYLTKSEYENRYDEHDCQHDFAWVCSNPCPLLQPVAMIGQLGIYNLDKLTHATAVSIGFKYSDVMSGVESVPSTVSSTVPSTVPSTCKTTRSKRPRTQKGEAYNREMLKKTKKPRRNKNFPPIKMDKVMPNSVTLNFKNCGTVDPESGLGDVAHIFVQEKTKWFAILNKIDIQTDEKSYYKIQLLESDNQNKYYIFQSWGHIGTAIGGKGNKTETFSSSSEAIEAFKQIYWERTGNHFGVDFFNKISGSYYPMDIEYDGDDIEKEISDQ